MSSSSRAFRLGLGGGGDGHVEERDAVPFHERLVVRVVGDHGHHLHGQFADPGAEQQVVEAVPELGHHDQHAALGTVRLQPPAHPEAVSHRGESGPQGVRGGGIAVGREVHPHEEVPFGAFAELLVVDDVAAVFQQEAGDGVDDARRLRGSPASGRAPRWWPACRGGEVSV